MAALVDRDEIAVDLIKGGWAGVVAAQPEYLTKRPCQRSIRRTVVDDFHPGGIGAVGNDRPVAFSARRPDKQEDDPAPNWVKAPFAGHQFGLIRL